MCRHVPSSLSSSWTLHAALRVPPPTVVQGRSSPASVIWTLQGWCFRLVWVSVFHLCVLRIKQ